MCEEKKEGTDDSQDLNFRFSEKREDGGHVDVTAAEKVTRWLAMRD